MTLGVAHVLIEIGGCAGGAEAHLFIVTGRFVKVIIAAVRNDEAGPNQLACAVNARFSKYSRVELMRRGNVLRCVMFRLSSIRRYS